MCLIEKMDIEVSMYSPDQVDVGVVPDPLGWPKPLRSYTSWIGEISLKMIKFFIMDPIITYVEEVEKWSGKDNINPFIKKLWTGIDGVYGGDKNKIKFLNVYRDPSVENSYMCEVTYDDSDEILAVFRIDFNVRKELDKFFDTTVLEAS